MYQRRQAGLPSLLIVQIVLLNPDLYSPSQFIGHIHMCSVMP